MEIWRSVRFSFFFNPKQRFRLGFLVKKKRKTVFQKTVFALTKQNTILKMRNIFCFVCKTENSLVFEIPRFGLVFLISVRFFDI